MNVKARVRRDRLKVTSKLETQIEAKVDGGKGDAPNHQWSGTSLRFQKPNGEWGDFVDLIGADGNTLELRLSDYTLEYRVVGDSDWISLGNVRGPSGREVELWLDGFNLKWRYVGELTWADLGNVRGPAGPGVPGGGDEKFILSKKTATSFDTEWIIDTPQKVKNMPAPANNAGPLAWNQTDYVILERSGNTFPVTNLFDGRLFRLNVQPLSLRIGGVDQVVASGRGALFEYNSVNTPLWRPLGGRFNLYSNVVSVSGGAIASIGSTTATTELIRIEVPGALLALGCTIRLKGTIVGSSSSNNSYAVNLNIHQTAGSTQFGVGSRATTAISGSVLFQWNRGIRVGSSSFLQAGPVNIESDTVGGVGVNLLTVSAVNVLNQSFFLTLTANKGAVSDVCRLTSFEVDLEYPN